MHVNCPHCHNAIEVVEEASLTNVECPSCGSQFSLLGEDPADDLNKTIPGGHTTRTIGRFELVNEVGKGAFGSVWRGKDPQLDRTVAVKIPRKGQLNKEESEQFFREARAAAQLKHPNIVPVHEIGKDGETIYIVSDFVQGVTLADRLTVGAMGMRESAELCIKVCRALHHAHEKGVIHRDLKPANIMLDDQGEPHVMDFGLAKREAGEITMTVDGQVLGTPAYMSPEQARGSAHDADGRSDLYSVGVILFQLLTGELPFRGNMRMLIHQVINDEAPSPLKLNSNIDKNLATVTTKCLEKDPDKRYQSAEELADDLQRYRDGKPIQSRPVSSLERGWRWCKRKPALSGALAVSTLLLLTLAIGGPIVAVQQAALKQKANDEAEKAKTAEAEARLSAQRSDDVLKIVTDSFKSVNPDEGSIAQMAAKEVLFNARESLKSSELDGSGKMQLLDTLTASFIGLGEYTSAISTAEENLALRAAKLGPDHPDTLAAMANLASNYAAAGRTVEAIELHEKTLALMTKKLGPDHPKTLTLMRNLSASYGTAGRTEEGLELIEKTLILQTAKLGPDHPETLVSINNLAVSYVEAGRTAEALELLGKTLALTTKTLGPDHPEAFTLMANLASSYRGTERYAEAVEMDEKTLALMTKTLGPEHPSTLRVMNNLAHSYAEAERSAQAIELAAKVLKKRREILGPDHPNTKQSELFLEFLRANKINDAIRGKVASMPEGSDLPLTDEELNQMREVCKQYPRGMYYNTLGVAKFRMDNYKESIAAAQQSIERLPKELKLPSAYPIDLAILAMSHEKLGNNNDQANKYRQQMTDAMQLDAFKDDAESKSFASEVVALFRDDGK